MQALYTARQLRTLERVTSAISLAREEVLAKELEVLHQEVVHLAGDLYMEREIGRSLSTAYESMLKE